MRETYFEMLKNTDNLKTVRDGCEKLIKYYDPSPEYQSTQLIKQAVLNLDNEDDFQALLIDLVVRIRRYHVEFLTHRINTRVLPLILTAIDTWNLKTNQGGSDAEM